MKSCGTLYYAVKVGVFYGAVYNAVRYTIKSICVYHVRRLQKIIEYANKHEQREQPFADLGFLNT